MLKFLLILALSLYILSKIGGFFFRAGAATQQRSQQRKPSDGNVYVNTNPNSTKNKGNFKGGDYVDYEEVK